MTESNPPGATPLDLPPAALKAPSNAPHPDSEEALQYGRHRVAQELDTIYPEPPPTLRARGTQNSAGRLSRRPSGTSTAADPAEAEGERARSPGAGGGQTKWLYGPVAKFWRTQISVVIEDGDPRDHLAIERTFLAYLRTSLALAMTGVITAQLFRLQHSINPNPEIGFYLIGVPLAAAFIGIGMVVLLVGAWRCWRQQNALIRGKVHAGGWELTVIMLLCILICTALFALLVAVDVDKSGK